MKKKLAIIGRGTAGCYAASHFNKCTDWDIDWYFDGNIKPQSVGEGSDLTLPKNLYANLGFTFDQLRDVDGFYKNGIYKKNWGPGCDFIHPFPPPSISMHFSAMKLQEFIISKLRDRQNIKFIDSNVEHEDIDADHIMDCSGFSNDMELFETAENIPVNSVYVTQCFWDSPRFDYTLTIARPHGWVFGIPLMNRCSIGYMYNNNCSTLDEVKEDVKTIFEDYNLTPSDTTNQFSFKNYYRKTNFDGRVAYNGNASFFLEPLEATSITTMDKISRIALSLWRDKQPINISNWMYSRYILQVENIISMHYANGSIFENKFWSMARKKGMNGYSNLMSDHDYRTMMHCESLGFESMHHPDYGVWPRLSFEINMPNLGLEYIPKKPNPA